MVKNVHGCAKYYLRGTQTEEIPDIPYFLQESLWLKSRFGMEQIGANKNPARRFRFIMQGTVAGLQPIAYPIPIGNFFSKRELFYLTGPNDLPRRRDFPFWSGLRVTI